MTTTMQEFEYVSIAMDDETLSDEMLDRLLADDEAGQKWYEYHLIRDYMQQHQQSVGQDAGFMHNPDFKAALAEISIEHRQRYLDGAEAALNTSVAPAANQTFKAFAVAASVAAVAVSVWQFWPSAAPEASMPMAEQRAPVQSESNVVTVSGNPEVKTASEPTVVVPNAAKSQIPEQQTTVRIESGAATQQTVVQ